MAETLRNPSPQKKSYAGAAWNQLIENESKESIAELYLDALDRIRDLEAQLKREAD